MKPEDFEQKLQQIPVRRLPADWREEILGSIEPARTFWWRLRDVLWPSPVAWAGLAAAWVVIFALHAATPVPSVSQAAPASANAVNLIVRRQQELASLLATASEPAPPRTTGPRSERRREVIAA